MSKGGSVSVATAPRVSTPGFTATGSKSGPTFAGGGIESGRFGGTATQFSSRGLEAFRNPARPQVLIKGLEGPAGAKMRIDSFGKPFSSPVAKAEFSRPGVQNSPTKLGAYASESAFVKPDTRSVTNHAPHAEKPQTTPFVPNTELLRDTTGGQTTKATVEQIKTYKEQMTDKATQQISRFNGQIQQRSANEARTITEGKVIARDWDYKSKPVSRNELVEVSRTAPEIRTTPPATIGETAQVVKVTGERDVAFQQELARIKRQVAALVEATPDNVDFAKPAGVRSVLPDTKPQTSGQEFGNLLKKLAVKRMAGQEKPVTEKKRNKEEPYDLHIIDVDGIGTGNVIERLAEMHNGTFDSAWNAAITNAKKRNIWKRKLRDKFDIVVSKVNKKAQRVAGITKHSTVKDWDELLEQKKEKSAFEPLPRVEARSTIVVQSAADTQQIVQSRAVSVMTAQQEEAIATVLPNTKPLATPEQVQQLYTQAQKKALENMGTAEKVIFSAGKNDASLMLILDKEAKRARQKAIVNGVTNARMSADGTVTGRDVVEAAEKHTTPQLSGKAKELGLLEDGSEVTLWNHIGGFGEMSHKEMLMRALQEEDSLRPVAEGENGSRVDERDLKLVLSKVDRKEEDRVAA